VFPAVGGKRRIAELGGRAYCAKGSDSGRDSVRRSRLLYAPPPMGMILDMASPSPEKRDPVAETRMTIGEHLNELRARLVRSLLAFVLACLLCIWPAKYFLIVLARPYQLILDKYDQPASFLQTSPIEVLLIYIKVVIFAALVLSGPYIIYQIWSFVAAGLYKHEKKWVRKLVPVSVGLFVSGVAFMYVFALLLALSFLVGFSDWLSLPSPSPTALERMIVGGSKVSAPSTQPATVELPKAPALVVDPEDPAPGMFWFNVPERKLKFRDANGTLSVRLHDDERQPFVTTHFKIGEYLTFVLVLTVAFGLAFQMPLVVVFLVRTGIVPLKTFKKYRKVVILITVIIAGMIAPADLMSHVLLSSVMILLFEIGLFVAGRGPKRVRAG
jgi:sec-independent protein translocase protein TatC